jgi:hypothetical protein
MDTERPKSPWCNRGHFAVATFLHRGVFRSAQRREWHVDADTNTLRHMTRGRVLRVDAELHDGQRLQVFNVYQATSGDMQLQQHTWQILTKSIVECRHQRILLGGDTNWVSKSSTRFICSALDAAYPTLRPLAFAFKTRYGAGIN